MARADAGKHKAMKIRQRSESELPMMTLCRYWVKPEQEEAFLGLLRAHWPLFRRLELVEEGPHLVLRGKEQERVFYLETFPWKSKGAMHRAHEHPEVGALWGQMAACCTSMEFPTVEEVEL